MNGNETERNGSNDPNASNQPNDPTEPNEWRMFNSSFDAIVPMLCVTLAALAVMGAEAFRGKGERMPLGGLGIVVLLGAAAASAFLWNRNTASFGVIVPTTSACS